QDELGGVEPAHLPADFRTDAATRASDQDGVVTDVVRDGLDVELYGLATEEVFDGHGPHLRDGDLAVDQVIHPGDGAYPGATGRAQVHDAAHLAALGRRDGDDDLFHGVLANQLWNHGDGPQDGHAMDVFAKLEGVVVDDAYGFVPGGVGLVDLADQHFSAVARAHDEDLVALAVMVRGTGGKLTDSADAKAQAADGKD